MAGVRKDYIDWAFKSLVIGIASLALSQFVEMKNSVVELNVKMAVLIERDSEKTKDIEDLQHRVKAIEARK